MPYQVDLHIHSSFSDGLLSPTEIIDKTRALGIKAVAITDHDTTRGLTDILARQNGGGPEIITGVELSAHHQLGSVHILGYGFDPLNSLLQEKLKTIQVARKTRNKAILNKLLAFGFPLSLEETRGLAKGQIGRPHIAQLMVQKGIVANEQEAFTHYLKKDAKAYVERELLPAEDAIAIIVQAGGIASLAHPATVDPTCSFLYKLIEDLYQKGLGAIEAYHPSHNNKHVAFFTKICSDLGLFATGGSDFHGRDRDRATLGCYGPNKFIPIEVYDVLTERLSSDSLSEPCPLPVGLSQPLIIN